MEKKLVYRQLNRLASLEDMRLQGAFCDVNIRVENVDFPAHKLILAAATKYFANMFMNRYQETDSKIIEIKGVSATNMKVLLTFAYTGEITFTETNVQDLTKDADYLELLDLKEAGIQFLKSCISVRNVCDVYRFADTLNSTSLMRNCKTFLQQHFRDVSLTDDYLDLNLEHLNDILSSNELHISAQLMFEAVMKWILNDVDERSIHLPKLLEFIQFSQIKNRFLTNYFSKGKTESIKHKHSKLVADVMSLYKKYNQGSSENEKCIVAIDCFTADYLEVYNPVSGVWKFIEADGTAQVISKAIVYKKKLYAAGDNGVQVYEPKNNMWESRSPMSVERPRRVPGIAEVQGYFYVCGGYYDDRQYSDIVERYCPESDKWQIMSPMTEVRDMHATIAFQGYVYAIGGYVVSRDSINSIDRYDPRTDQWTILDSKMNMNRADFGAAVLNGKLYVCGGITELGLGETTMDSVEVYDPETNKWKCVKSMNTKRCRLSVVAHLGKLWAIGGCQPEKDIQLKTVEVYDPDKNSWSYAQPMIKIEGEVTGAVVPKW